MTAMTRSKLGTCRVHGGEFADGINVILAPGDRVWVFDGIAWQKAGGDDPKTLNKQFFKLCTVLRRYVNRDRWGYTDVCVEVRWDEDGHISKGHFETFLCKAV